MANIVVVRCDSSSPPLVKRDALAAHAVTEQTASAVAGQLDRADVVLVEVGTHTRRVVDVLRRLRSAVPCIPMIALGAGFRNAAWADVCSAAGVSEGLRHPFPSRLLREAVEKRLLEARRTRRVRSVLKRQAREPSAIG